MSKSKAFTLAEVLITLVIIGVIAAMTIPTLMGNTNDQEIKTALKKAYSSIGQAIRLEKALYGKTYIGCCGQMATALKNHLSVIEDCYGGSCNNFKTADGMIYYVTDDPDDQIRVDVNGEKGNGQEGVDLFPFWYSRQNSELHFEYDDGITKNILFE